jgi:hypothetical protein
MNINAMFHPHEDNMNKSNEPHAPNSPEDKAHDAVETKETVNQAVDSLEGRSAKSAMIAHMKKLVDKSQLRSPENQEAGELKKNSCKVDVLSKAVENFKKKVILD